MYDSKLIMSSHVLDTQKSQTPFHDGPFLDYDPVDEGAGRCSVNAAAPKLRQPWRPLLRRSAAPAVN